MFFDLNFTVYFVYRENIGVKIKLGFEEENWAESEENRINREKNEKIKWNTWTLLSLLFR